MISSQVQILYAVHSIFFSVVISLLLSLDNPLIKRKDFVEYLLHKIRSAKKKSFLLFGFSTSLILINFYLKHIILKYLLCVVLITGIIYSLVAFYSFFNLKQKINNELRK